jgi:arylsulfatase A
LGERALFYDYLGMSAMRKGRWKILREKREGAWRLFDLVSDVGESRDLAGERAGLVNEMAGEFSRWKARFKREAL